MYYNYDTTQLKLYLRETKKWKIKLFKNKRKSNVNVAQQNSYKNNKKI